MKLTIDSKLLLQGLEVVKPVVSSNKLVPVCDNILLKIDKESITLLSTNTHQSIIHMLTCECDCEGDVLIPFKDVYGLLETLPTCQITIEFKEGELEISCDTGTYNITFTDKVIDFPEIALIESPDRQVEIASSLVDAIQDKTLKFIHPEAAMSTMHGVAFDFKKGYLNVVGLQINIMSVFKIPCKSKGEGLFFVQKEAISLMSPFSYKGEISLKFSKKKFQVENSSTILITNLIDDNFQPYEQFMIKDHPYWFDISTKELLQSVARARKFSGEELLGVVVTEESIEIISDNFAKGKGFSEKYIPEDASIEGEMKFGLNAKFVIDTLNSFRSEFVRVHLSPDKPFISITDQDDHETSFIQMSQYKFF